MHLSMHFSLCVYKNKTKTGAICTSSVCLVFLTCLYAQIPFIIFTMLSNSNTLNSLQWVQCLLKRLNHCVSAMSRCLFIFMFAPECSAAC